MLPHYSAKELASMELPCLSIGDRAVMLKANKEKWPFTSQSVKGGYEKRYLSRLLPDDIRIAIAARAAIKGIAISPTCEGAAAGHKYALKLKQELAKHCEQEQITKEQGLAAYNQLPEAIKQVVDARYELLKARDAFIFTANLPLKKGSIAFCEHYKDGSINFPEAIRTIIGKTLSWSSLNRWQQSQKKSGLVGLATGYKSPNKGKSTLSPGHRNLVKAMLQRHPHVAMEKLKQAMEARFPDESLPHISSIRRYVKKWKKDNESLLLYISNPDAWKNKYQFALGDASEQVERLNQVWEFDSTPTDLMLADGRHNIIGVIDILSRRLKLLVSKTSKSSAVAALTRNALLDWGVPEIAKTDNGADYISKHMVRVFDNLDIEQILCPPFTPECKPHIERAFRTFSHDIVELMPGYVGHNINDRKAIEARRSFANRLMKIGGDPVECEQLTAEELQSLCDRWCAAIYEQNPHRGLNGQTPAEIARAWTEPVRKITDDRALDILLSEAPQGGGMRTITAKNGVRVDNVTFISDEMAGHEGEDVLVLLDKTDLGTIYLFNKDDNGNLNYLCTAIDPLRTGHNRAEIAAKTRARQKKIMQEGSKELRKIAKKEAVDSVYTEILEHRESKIANIIPIPKAREEYSNTALKEAAKAVADRDTMGRDQDEMEELLEDISQEREVEAAAVEKKKKKGIVPIFSTRTDRYQFIRDRDRKGGLTSVEVEFLDEFYQTKQGSTFMDLEGDLREKYGFAYDQCRTAAEAVAKES